MIAAWIEMLLCFTCRHFAVSQINNRRLRDQRIMADEFQLINGDNWRKRWSKPNLGHAETLSPLGFIPPQSNSIMNHGQHISDLWRKLTSLLRQESISNGRWILFNDFEMTLRRDDISIWHIDHVKDEVAAAGNILGIFVRQLRGGGTRRSVEFSWMLTSLRHVRSV